MKILIIGGNRFFGKRLASKLANNHDLYLLNRGNLDDGLGDRVKRFKCDRNDFSTFSQNVKNHHWDIVFDHCCYNAQQAREVCKAFKDRVSKYIFISSQSVYEEGSNLNEDCFKPLNYTFKTDVDQSSQYAEAKRQAEAVLFKEASFSLIAVRLPIVQGEDDYTERLLFHINIVKQSKGIYFPNLEAKISFIHSWDVANSLESLMDLDFEGAINIASSLPIKLSDLMKIIEDTVGRKAIYTSRDDQGSFSPYGINSDWFMSTDEMKYRGIEISSISEWLPRLIRQLVI